MSAENKYDQSDLIRTTFKTTNALVRSARRTQEDDQINVTAYIALTGAEPDPALRQAVKDVFRTVLFEAYPMLVDCSEAVIELKNDEVKEVWKDRMETAARSCYEQLIVPILDGTHKWSSQLASTSDGMPEVVGLLKQKITFAHTSLIFTIDHESGFDFFWIATLTKAADDDENMIVLDTTEQATG